MNWSRWTNAAVLVAVLAGCESKAEVVARCEAISKTSKVAVTSDDWRF